MSWIIDEQITKKATQGFNAAGIKGQHIDYDLGLGGIKDPEIFKIMRSRKKALITADQDFKTKYNNEIKSTPGVIFISTDDEEKQVRWVKKAIQHKGLNTAKKRFGKKVVLIEGGGVIIDCKTSSQIKFSDDV